MNKIAAIVLAAGKGQRMSAKLRSVGSKILNKVVLPLGNKQMILHTMALLKSLEINNIIVVVGFAKKSVMDVVGNRAVFVEQRKRLGTAHAVSYGLKKIDQTVNNVLVLNGDDSAFYTKEVISKLVKVHVNKNAMLTFLTIELDNPEGLGRVVRGATGGVNAVVEDRDSLQKYKTIKEVNPACYMFDLGFLGKYLGRIKKSKISGEYYLTSLIDIAIKNNEKVETVKGGKLLWRGINTIEELKEAQRLFLQTK